jgi:hypothetical protein
VARALVVTLRDHNQSKSRQSLDLAARYLSFLQHAQLPDGHFHNLMSYDRRFIDERGSEDTLGRAMWGLGTAVARAPEEGMRRLAREMFERALGAARFHHPRAVAYAICGLCEFLSSYTNTTGVRRCLDRLSEQLVLLFDLTKETGWPWFGDELTYANAKMSFAMLSAYRFTQDERLKQIGLESLDFLIRQTYSDDQFDFIGNRGWFKKGQPRALFGQQPIEAGYTVEACFAAYEVSGKERYLELARAAAEWLLGRNRLGERLYDPASGACSDGLDAHGASLNSGAESCICALLALLVLSEQRIISRNVEPQIARPAPALPGRGAAA